MSITRRVFVSMPADEWLSRNQNDLKWAVVDQIERLGFTPEIFTNPRGGAGLASGKAWTPDDAEKVMRRCVGAALIGLPRWGLGKIKLPSEFCHYEGAIARTLGLPTLVLRQNDVLDRVVFNYNFGPYIGRFDETANASWVKTKEFKTPFQYWTQALAKRRDVFLGYCSSSSNTAKRLKTFLTDVVGVTVLDWKEFKPGRSILDQIEHAAASCSSGIFLFTKDDPLAGKQAASKAVPRDNVVFEAGYFASIKGKDHVLIVLEAGAKMPADLGGDIYASLKERSKIATIKDTVTSFVEAL